MVEAASAAFAVEDLVHGHDGWNGGTADVAVVFHPDGGVGEGGGIAGGDDVFRIRRADQKARGVGHEPADFILGSGGEGEGQGAVILGASVEVVEVVRF